MHMLRGKFASYNEQKRLFSWQQEVRIRSLKLKLPFRPLMMQFEQYGIEYPAVKKF